MPDPSLSNLGPLDRRTFTRLAAAGTAGLATAPGLVAAAADAPGLGKPHPPLVAENDPAITVDLRPVMSADAVTGASRSIDAYRAYPKTLTASTPGVVVIQAIWGVDAQLRDVVRRLAVAGYAAIAPNLYTGLGAPSGDGATDFAPFREISMKLVDAQVDRDLLAAATALPVGAPQRKVGAIGFCMGGGIALRQAVDNDATFAAVSVFYGKVRYGTTDNKGPITPIALAYANDIISPLLGSFGAKDTSIVAADVMALDERLTADKRVHGIKIYDEAGHAFFDDTRESYVASAATDAWTRTLAWFHQHLS